MEISDAIDDFLDTYSGDSIYDQGQSLLDEKVKRFKYERISDEESKEVRNFQDNETIKVFLISLKAGGVGLNLTVADYVYLIDPWWNLQPSNRR